MARRRTADNALAKSLHVPLNSPEPIIVTSHDILASSRRRRASRKTPMPLPWVNLDGQKNLNDPGNRTALFVWSSATRSASSIQLAGITMDFPLGFVASEDLYASCV